MPSLSLGQDVANKRDKETIGIAGHIVAKSYPLYQAVGLCRFGSLININPSDVGLLLHCCLPDMLLISKPHLFQRDALSYPRFSLQFDNIWFWACLSFCFLYSFFMFLNHVFPYSFKWENGFDSSSLPTVRILFFGGQRPSEVVAEEVAWRLVQRSHGLGNSRRFSASEETGRKAWKGKRTVLVVNKRNVTTTIKTQARLRFKICHKTKL